MSQPPAGGYPPHGYPQQAHPQQAHPQQPYPQHGHLQQDYPPYGYRPLPPPAHYRVASGLSYASLGLAALLLVMEILDAVLAWPAGQVYADVARAHRTVDGVVTGYDLVNFLWVPAVVAAYVVSCLWLWRVRENAEALSGAPHTRRRGWVWGGWVVPVVSLWFPFQVVRDVRRATAPRDRPGNALLGWWWAFWLLEVWTTQLGSQLTPVSGVPVEGLARALGPVESVNVVFAVVAFVLWCRVVRRVTTEQEAAAAWLRSAWLSPAGRT
jgi:hypothetical protein